MKTLLNYGILYYAGADFNGLDADDPLDVLAPAAPAFIDDELDECDDYMDAEALAIALEQLSNATCHMVRQHLTSVVGHSLLLGLYCS